jgi:isovaleryl-CoA dehydrogenase
MMRNLEIERLGLAAMSLGIARRCLEIMTGYASQRRAFGHPLADFGQIQAHIADSYAKVEAIRAMLYGVARTVSPTRRNRLGTDAVKLFASTAAKQVADASIQVLGGYGYCTEYRVEQFWRDANRRSPPEEHRARPDRASGRELAAPPGKTGEAFAPLAGAPS